MMLDRMRQLIRLELVIPADWDRIDTIREGVGLCLAAVFGHGELKEALSMVSAELLENAVKYAKPGPSGIGFSLRREGERLIVAVTNVIDETISLHELRERIDWLRQFADPAEAYIAALAKIYEQPPPSAGGGSGLGLVRIAYEGGCQVECDTSVPGQLTVWAARDLSQPTGM